MQHPETERNNNLVQRIKPQHRVRNTTFYTIFTDALPSDQMSDLVP